MDRADVDDCAAIYGSSSGRKIYERRAENFVFSGWMQSARGGKRIYGHAGGENLRVESHQLFRCCGVDDGAGSSLPICGQNGSDGHAVHRDVYAADGTFVI